MQYAQVLINSKTDELDKTFTYQIPPKILPYIKTGSIVKIPFGPREKKGIVFKMIRNTPSNIKYKLKYIKSLEFNIPILNTLQVKLAQMISNYYLISLGQLVFFMIPNLSKRLLKKYSNINQSIQAKTIVTNHNNITQKSYSIYDTKKNRIKHYIQLIIRAFKVNKSVILLFPDYWANNIFIKILAKKFSKESIVFNPEDKSTTITEKWLNLNNHKNYLIIGTRNTIFQIPNNLGLIIIDEPDHFGYKEEQATHYNTKKVAEFVSKITGANLIFGDNFPSIKDYFSKNIKRLVFNKNFIVNKNNIIIDNSQYKTNFFSYPIEKIVSEHIKNNKNLLILTKGHGISSGLICTNCEKLIYCPRCNKLMFKMLENEHILHCPICSYEMKIPIKCSNCQSSKFSEFGLPTQRLANIIKEKFTNSNIKILKNDLDFINVDNCKNTIFISSNYALSWKNLSFNSVVVLDWENWQFSSGYNYYQKFVKSFIDLCEVSKKNIYIQTTNPDDENIRKIIALKFDNIYKKDLYMRKKFMYPPFYDVIKISYRDSNYKKSQDCIKKIHNKIIKILKNCEISEIIDEGKKRDNYYFNFIIKAKIENIYQLKKSILSEYKHLGLSNFFVDVDPLKII